MICSKCKAEVEEDGKFCPQCGKKLKPLKLKTGERHRQPGRTAEEKSFRPDGDEMGQSGMANRIPSGAAWMLAFACAECLPYLLKALVFLSVRDSLGAFRYTLTDYIGIIAGVVALTVVSYEKGKKGIIGKKFGSALMFFGFYTVAREAGNRIFSQYSELYFESTWIYAAIGAGLLIVLAAFMTGPLQVIFSDKEKYRHRGRILAGFFLLLGLLGAEILDTAFLYVPIAIEPSVLSTLASYLLLAVFEAGCAEIACRILLKFRKEVGENKRKNLFPEGVRRFGSQVFGGGLLIVCFLFSLIWNRPSGDLDIVLEQVEYQIVQGEYCLMQGDMEKAREAYLRAFEYCRAWQNVSEGEEYVLPPEYRDDTTLCYLNNLFRTKEEMQHYLITSYSEDELYMMFPLMERQYKRREERGHDLDEKDAAHRAELVMACIAREQFEFFAPTVEEIREMKGELKKALTVSAELENRVRAIGCFAKAQKGEANTQTLVDEMMWLAKENPEDISIQYMAAIIGSQNRWDDAYHFEDTCEAILRLHTLWRKAYSTAADTELLKDETVNTANLLLSISKYEEAIPFLEEACSYDSGNVDVKQKLVTCYSKTGQEEKAYEIARELAEQNPENTVALWSYSVSSLKKGNIEEAVAAASKLADMVKTYDGEEESEADAFLFHCIQYLGMNDDGYWTDYQYRVYDEYMPEETAELFDRNPFLRDYVAAIYYEKNNRDPERALPYAQNALSVQPNSSRLWYLYGMIQYDLQNLEEAKEAYLVADSYSPEDASVLFALANVYDAMGEYRAAYDLCVKVANMYPNGVDHTDDMYGVSYHVHTLKDQLEYVLKEGE